jgi:asparagine synthase (glutamine-hydrolysing)
MFIGMFAFVIYDLRDKSLFVARDRLGIKPLYYQKTQNGLCFSSEIKSIIKINGAAPVVNLRAISSYLSYRYTLLGDSFYEGISQLEPGYFLHIKHNGETVHKRYWSFSEKLSEQKIDHGEKYYLENLRELFHSSVKYRMIADVPVGAYLSGGVDSSAVVAEMSKLTSKPIETFTIGFSEKDYNEFEYSQIVSKKFQTNHHEILLSSGDYLGAMQKLISFKDAPLGVPNEVPLYLMSQELRKYITVVLSGEGGDEIFGGYGRIFRSADDFEKLNNLSNSTASKLKLSLLSKYKGKKLNSKIDHFLYLYQYTKSDAINDLFCSNVDSGKFEADLKASFEYYMEEVSKASYVNQMMYVFEKLHLPGLLQRVDVTTMAASVEARVPFVDHRLVEFAFTIPEKYKLKWNSKDCLEASRALTGDSISEVFDTPKYILKKAFEKQLPSTILYRKKMGFPVPLSKWFEGDFMSTAKVILQESKLVDLGIFNKKAINVLLSTNFKSQDHAAAMKLWMIINLELFLGNKV